MPINLKAPEVKELKPRITVLGVGGAGGNAVNNMITAKLEGVDFVVANTDAQALAQNKATRKIQMGVRITEGLGAGAKPDVGRAAAEESLDEILEHVGGAHMLFITAGMGGGTGTGSAPVIARAVRELGILTVGVVTKPFNFEGDKRMRSAERGLEELQNYVDTLIIIPNQNLFRIANERTTFAQAFSMADDVLHSGVRGVTDLMVMPGLINLDFADIKSVMSEMGKAMMGTGEAEGEGRALKAAEAAISNPLLDDVSMKGARGVLINVTGGPDLMLFEVDEAANRIRAEVDPDANIIFGSTIAEDMEGKVRVSVVATGIDAESFTMKQPEKFGMNVERFPSRKRLEEPVPAPVAARNPAPAATASAAALREASARLIEQAAAQATALQPQPSPVHRQQEAVAQNFAPQSAPSMAEAEPMDLTDELPPPPLRQTESAPMARSAPLPTPEKKRGGWIFGGRKREAKAEPAMERPAPQANAARMAPSQRPAAQPQPTDAPRTSDEDLFGGVTEDDRFEIPAFLRRQAN
jgi:cell division protein FtsZ